MAVAYLQKALGHTPVTEYAFIPGRRFRLDFAWPQRKVGLEVDGGVFGIGRPCPTCKRRRVGAHSSISDIKRNMEKRNLAIVHGWRIITVLPEKFAASETIDLLREILNAERAQ